VPPSEEVRHDDADAGDDWGDVVPRTCACGYVNTGSPRCPACGAKNADAPRGDAGWGESRFATGAPSPTGERQPAAKAGSKAVWTVVGTVVLNIIQQVVVLVLIASHKLEAGPAIRLSLLSGLAFYSIVALVVMAGSARLGVRPVISSGRALTGAAEGAVVGAGAAIILVAVAFVVTGHPVLDPVAAAITNQSVAAFVVGALLIAVVAPVVEELVFRGFLAEALRPRGTWAALVVSSAAFSVAHLRFAQFRYYVALGLVLGWLYWRRGLVASVAAHACFNGMLVVAAVAASHGPPVVLSGGGASITVPAAWHTVAHPAADVIAASGPSGATIEVARIETGVELDIQKVTANVTRGRLAGPAGTSIDPSSVALLDLPAGQAVTMAVTVGTHHGRAVMFPRGTVLWVATVETAGSSRAATDFQKSLDTLHLP
jgi:membrane protease YdiL (CAAX protease family)